MLTCFVTKKSKDLLPITLVPKSNFQQWQEQQNSITKGWLSSTKFNIDTDTIRFIPDQNGQLSGVLCCVTDLKNFWEVGNLPLLLPEGTYTFKEASHAHALGWGLGAYQFTRYKKPSRKPAQLYLASEHAEPVLNTLESIYMVRDLINTPTDDMGPREFAEAAVAIAKQYHAKVQQIVGEELLKQNYASIYTVGRASDDPPRLLDMRWGNSKHAKVTLVGKGVCFDTGGLDIKTAPYMQLMKKDMGGAAQVLGLARMIMAVNLPICLRVLIPLVENSVAGNAYRPGDVIKSRKGLTIEIGNTDAEGRVILADALTEAASEKPELLIDIATLTGAARVALGTELPAVFCNNDDLVRDVIKQGKEVYDPMWQLPLFEMYREFINSPIADINNNSSESYGGAITAAIFLKEFVPNDIPWLHFDLMAWNLRPRPGRPVGGEASVIRALFAYLSERFTK